MTDIWKFQVTCVETGEVIDLEVCVEPEKFFYIPMLCVCGDALLIPIAVGSTAVGWTCGVCQHEGRLEFNRAC